MSLVNKLYLLENTALKLNLLSNREIWVHPINLEREQYGEYHHLMPQLRRDPERFQKYFRMSPGTFDYVVQQVSPGIMKTTTNYRKPISPEERLAVTLR